MSIAERSRPSEGTRATLPYTIIEIDTIPEKWKEPLSYLRNEILDQVWIDTWNDGGFHGRTWAKRGKGVETDFEGSHIVVGSRNGELIIFLTVKGEIRMYQFGLVPETAIGSQIFELLDQHGITFSRP
ncbi:MAG: hypothetical protein Q7S03_02440 [bacterium]|nr:hypothetical protein [bacterium]